MIGAICAGVRYTSLSEAEFFHFVSITCIFIHLFVILSYLFNIDERYKQLPWHGIVSITKSKDFKI